MQSFGGTKPAGPRVKPEKTQPRSADLISFSRLVELVNRWSESPMVQISSAGQSKAGRDIFVVAVSDPENLRQSSGFRRTARDTWKSLVHFPSLGSPTMTEPDLDLVASQTKPALLLHCGGFGFEASHVEAVCQVVEHLLTSKDAETATILRNSVVLVMPMINPDARDLAIGQWEKYPMSPGWEGVGNGYGFIMNRDSYCLSQLETQAVHRVINKWRPTMALDTHEDMGILGAQRTETCWTPPFREPRHKHLDGSILDVVAKYSGAIAKRWRDEGFDVWYEPQGSFMSNLVLDGRCDLHLDLHGIPCLFTESARTPGSQTWEDRNRQKVLASLTFLHKAATEYRDLLRTQHAYWKNQIQLGNSDENRAFVIPRGSSKTRNGQSAELLASLLLQHDVQVYSAEKPFPAYIVPLGQPDRSLLLAMLQVEPWNALSLPPALGAECLKFASLPASQKNGFLKSPLRPVASVREYVTAPPRKKQYAPVVVVRNHESAIPLVNHALKVGADVRWLLTETKLKSGGLPAGTFCISDAHGIVQEFGRKNGIPITGEPRFPANKSASLSLPRLAVYVGQGANEKCGTSSGETLWALDSLGFSYAQLSEQDIHSGSLDHCDVLIVPGGSGSEMLNGWNVTVQNYKSPWQVPGRPVGLGKTGIKKIVSFLRKGGRYIGISSGGGSLACRELGGFADVTIADHGLGQARIYMHSEAPNHPVMLGYDGHRDQEGNWHEREIPSFYFCEQLWPRMEDFSGPVFKTGAKSTALASFTHADYELWTENMERDPVSLNREHAAIVYQRVGKGSLVLFGTNLGFRAQWISNYRFFSNSIYSWDLR